MKFSIIVPVYNVAPYLRECLDSVLAQTCNDWECICVDDGSTDGSGIILDEYAECDARFKVIHKSNGGVSSARNAAIENAKGDWIGFLDGDDIWHPELLRICEDMARQNGRAEVLAFTCNYFQDGSPVEWGRASGQPALEINMENVYPEAATHYGFCEKIYRRNLIGDTRFEPLRNGEDVLFMMAVLLKARLMLKTPVKMYGYRQRKGSASNNIGNPGYFRDILASQRGILAMIQCSTKRVDLNLLHIFANDITEGLSGVFFSLPQAEMVDCFHEWRIELAAFAENNRFPVCYRLRAGIFKMLPSRLAAKILFKLPYEIKKNGLGRFFRRRKS